MLVLFRVTMVMCRYGSLGACIESLCTEEADFDASTRFEALDFAAIIEQVGMTQKEGRRLFRILDTQRVGVVALEDLALAVAGKLPRRRSSVGSPRPHPRRRASASPSVDSGRKGSAGTMAQPSTAVPTVKNPVVQCKVNPPSVPMAPQSGTSEVPVVLTPSYLGQQSSLVREPRAVYSPFRPYGLPPSLLPGLSASPIYATPLPPPPKLSLS